MPRPSGPSLVASLPGGRVSEPLREGEDVWAQLARMAPLTRDVPEAVWWVEVPSS